MSRGRWCRIAALAASALLLTAPAARADDTAGVDPRDFGARCDGVTDDIAALTAAIRSAKSRGVPVRLPAATCAYGNILNLDGVKLIGRGDASVLWDLNPSRQAIFLRGSGAEVRNLMLTGVRATRRAAPWEGVRIVAFGASDFVIDNVTIDGATGGGIQTARGATRGVISNNRVRNTLADGIHITGAASHITITGNLVEFSGDDGIAVVSYQSDPGPSHHITATRNTVLDNRGGRGMSIVGGEDVLYENNVIRNTGRYACLYLAQEDGWKTRAVRNVIVRDNTLARCGDRGTGHAAVMLFADSAENEGVQILRNDIEQQGPRGIRAFGRNRGVTVDGNRVRGADRETDLPPGLEARPYGNGRVGAQ